MFVNVIKSNTYLKTVYIYCQSDKNLMAVVGPIRNEKYLFVHVKNKIS